VYSSRSLSPSRLLVAGAVALGGCGVQKYAMSDVALDYGGAGTGLVFVATQDRRLEVRSGDEDPQWVGVVRSGMGIPYDVGTANGKPLAIEASAVIAASLERAGFHPRIVEVAPATPERAVATEVRATSQSRGLILSILEWKSDTYARISVEYELRLVVVDAGGNEIGRANASLDESLGFNLGNPGAEAKTSVPRAFGKALEQLLNDPVIVKALSTGGA
jgi:hypothetical protein